ncbi:MAG: hypothetical protein ACRDVZ_12110 [Jiangellaceae bacterium]
MIDRTRRAHPVVDDLISKIGALLVDNRTFRGDDPHGVTEPMPLPGITFVGDLDTGVLDEMFVIVASVLRGDGVRLFERLGGAHVKLEPLSLTHTQHVTNHWMGVVR